MSDWKRSGRQDEQRRYGDDRDRWGFGGRDRGSGRGGERRSFGQDEGRYGGRREAEEWDDPQRAYGTQGAGSRGYGRQDYADRRGEDRGYGEQGFGERDYGGYAYGERGEDRTFGRFGQGYGDYRDRPRYGERGGGFPRNEPLARVTDGETDPARASFGEHRGRGPKTYTRSDERIGEDINERLTDDPWLDASGIEVAVAKSEVTLNGTVDSREAKRRAEDIAEQVLGVKHVQNNLRVERQGETGATQQAAPHTRGTTHS